MEQERATVPSETAEVPLGIVGLSTGETYRLARRVTAKTSGEERQRPEVANSGGVIYTEHEMPALEELLRQYRVAVAILEHPAPDLVTAAEPSVDIIAAEAPHSVAAVGPAPEKGPTRPVLTTKPWRIALAGGIAGAVLAAGVALMATAVSPDGIRTNLYIALSTVLAGITFVAAVATALRPKA